MNNGHMPANPVKGCDGRFIDCTDDNMQWIKQCKPSIGLTKREAFAMAAMQGLFSNSGTIKFLTDIGSTISEQSVLAADKLLAELEK